jgi:hypothetical protein
MGLENSRIADATKIQLGFMRRGNRDLLTKRRVEIPVPPRGTECAGEHRRLFEGSEGTES